MLRFLHVLPAVPGKPLLNSSGPQITPHGQHSLTFDHIESNGEPDIPISPLEPMNSDEVPAMPYESMESRKSHRKPVIHFGQIDSHNNGNDIYPTDYNPAPELHFNPKEIANYPATGIHLDPINVHNPQMVEDHSSLTFQRISAEPNFLEIKEKNTQSNLKPYEAENTKREISFKYNPVLEDSENLKPSVFSSVEDNPIIPQHFLNTSSVKVSETESQLEERKHPEQYKPKVLHHEQVFHNKKRILDRVQTNGQKSDIKHDTEYVHQKTPLSLFSQHMIALRKDSSANFHDSYHQPIKREPNNEVIEEPLYLEPTHMHDFRYDPTVKDFQEQFFSKNNEDGRRGYVQNELSQRKVESNVHFHQSSQDSHLGLQFFNTKPFQEKLQMDQHIQRDQREQDPNYVSGFRYNPKLPYHAGKHLGLRKDFNNKINVCNRLLFLELGGGGAGDQSQISEGNLKQIYLFFASFLLLCHSHLCTKQLIYTSLLYKLQESAAISAVWYTNQNGIVFLTYLLKYFLDK